MTGTPRKAVEPHRRPWLMSQRPGLSRPSAGYEQGAPRPPLLPMLPELDGPRRASTRRSSGGHPQAREVARGRSDRWELGVSPNFPARVIPRCLAPLYLAPGLLVALRAVVVVWRCVRDRGRRVLQHRRAKPSGKPCCDLAICRHLASPRPARATKTVSWLGKRLASGPCVRVRCFPARRLPIAR